MQDYGLFVIPKQSEIKFLTEPEIWYILDSIVNTAKLFENNNYFHGDIQPNTCFLAHNGDLKILDNSLLNFGKSGYEKMCYEKNYKAILSPQLMQALRSKQRRPSYDKQLNEVWCIGMTALCIASYTDYEVFYDYKNNRVMYDRILRSFNFLR